MGSRWWSSSTIVLAALLATAGLMSGCGQNECLDCGGDNPCPSFLGGTFVCDQVASMDTCSAWMLLEGPTWVRVVEQDDNRLLLEKTTTVGEWYTYTGRLCNTNDQEGDRFYTFWGDHDVDGVDPDEQVLYSLSGQMKVGADGVPTELHATINLQLFQGGTGQAACSLTGQVDGLYEQ